MDIKYWELIAKKLSGELSSEEEKQLSLWLNTDSANQEKLKAAEYIWKTSGSLTSDFEPNTEKAWLSLKERIENSGKTKPFPVGRLVWLKIAAAIAVIIMMGFLVKYMVNIKDSTGPVLAEIVTTDSVKVFYLSDKTRISLNKNSRFTYPEKFTDSLRIVSLAGEAFFEVTADSHKPFIIQAGQTKTRVLGTSFNIKAHEKDEDVQVTVVSGKVQLEIENNTETQPVMLDAGDEVFYNKNSASIKKQKSKNTDFMWWKKHNLEREVKQLLKKVKKRI